VRDRRLARLRSSSNRPRPLISSSLRTLVDHCANVSTYRKRRRRIADYYVLDIGQALWTCSTSSLLFRRADDGDGAGVVGGVLASAIEHER